MTKTIFFLFLLSVFFGCENQQSSSSNSGEAQTGEQIVVHQNNQKSASSASPAERDSNSAEVEKVDPEHILEAQSSDPYVEDIPTVGPKVERAKDWREQIELEKRTEVTWDDLYEFNYQKGEPTPFLKAISGKLVRLPGFVIPLTDGDVEEMKEFLIVPEPMMCIHVPPPPPNLLLYGTADPPIAINSLWEPLWLDGEIRVEKKQSIYAEAGYVMTVTGAEPYNEPE